MPSALDGDAADQATYTDAMNLPLFSELEKLNPPIPSLIASLKYEKMGPKAAIPAQNDLLKNGGQMPTNDSIGAVLSNVVPTLNWRKGWDSNPR